VIWKVPRLSNPLLSRQLRPGDDVSWPGVPYIAEGPVRSKLGGDSSCYSQSNNGFPTRECQVRQAWGSGFIFLLHSWLASSACVGNVEIKGPEFENKLK